MDRWLLVEDEPDLYVMLVNLYDLFGVQSVGFADGESASSWLHSLEQKSRGDDLPKLALIDIRLPGQLDGIDVSAMIRHTPPIADIPIVLMTAYRLSPAQEEAAMVRSGADLLIMKPLPDTDKLRTMLFDLLP